MFPFATEVFAQSASGGGTTNPFFQAIPFILIFVVFYFLIIRPQHKKQKQLQSMISSLEKGDQVVTNGGIHGTIVKVTEHTLTVEIADKVKIVVDRAQIGRKKEGTTE